MLASMNTKKFRHHITH